MSKKCIGCNSIIDDDAIFCDECGMKQVEESGNTDNAKQVKHNSESHELEHTSQESRRTDVQVQSNKKQAKEDRVKNPTHLSILSLICSLISYPLIATFILPLITVPTSIILGIKGLRSTKKIPAIIGISLSIGVIVFYIWAIFIL